MVGMAVQEDEDEPEDDDDVAAKVRSVEPGEAPARTEPCKEHTFHIFVLEAALHRSAQARVGGRENQEQKKREKVPLDGHLAQPEKLGSRATVFAGRLENPEGLHGQGPDGVKHQDVQSRIDPDSQVQPAMDRE